MRCIFIFTKGPAINTQCEHDAEANINYCRYHEGGFTLHDPGRTAREAALPTSSSERKRIPLATGCLYYFPAALAEVAKLSRIGNDKHNPGQPLHHARGKSSDHADCILRHQIDVGTIDPDTGLDHATMVAWRALAQLQELCEARGAPLARGAKLPEGETK